MERIKTQLGNATASASSQDRLKKLEKHVADTKVTSVHRDSQRGRKISLIVGYSFFFSHNIHFAISNPTEVCPIAGVNMS